MRSKSFDVFQLDGMLGHRQRTEHGQRLANDGNDEKDRTDSAGHGLRS